MVIAVAALVVSTGSACASATPGGAGPVDGVWRAEGYGLILSVANGKAQEYQTTSVSCLPSDDIEQMGAPGADGGVGFGEDGQVERTLRPSGPGRIAMRELGTAADIPLDAIPAVPEQCTRSAPDDPVSTFDVLVATFAEQYNSTAAKRIDWEAVKHRYRPEITADTSSDQLYGILRDIVRPLDDAHVELDAGDTGSYSGGLRPGTRDSVDGADKLVEKHLRDIGARNERTWARGAITYADLPDGRGYLRFTSFDGWGTRPGGYEGRQVLLQQVLDSVFTADHVRTWRGLVLDVSNNGGGDDQLGIDLAARLTDVAYPAYTKRARDGSTDPAGYTAPRTVTVTPAAGKPHYTGPMRILTSDLSVSAAETVTEALMARTPAPRRVGTATQGVFADNQSRKLPNGWTVGLGTENYTASDGRDYETVGIPPNVEVPMYTPDQLDAGTFPALDLPGDD
jgi:hypothetical protein